MERALAPGDVACVVTEPVLTNSGVIQPDPGFHAALRALTRERGTLMVIDEAHTLVCGPGGLTARFGLEPDILTLGKFIAGSLPLGAYGMTTGLAERFACPDLHHLMRAYFANRGIWEAIGSAGPTVSIAATPVQADHYLGCLAELLGDLTA